MADHAAAPLGHSDGFLRLWPPFPFSMAARAIRRDAGTVPCPPTRQYIFCHIYPPQAYSTICPSGWRPRYNVCGWLHRSIQSPESMLNPLSWSSTRAGIRFSLMGGAQSTHLSSTILHFFVVFTMAMQGVLKYHGLYPCLGRVETQHGVHALLEAHPAQST